SPTVTRGASPSATFGLPPTPSTTPTPVCTIPEGWTVYTVQEGEVLYNLALEAGTTVEIVRQANCLNSNILSIGQELWLPNNPATVTPTITNTPLPTPKERQPRPTVEPTNTAPPPPTTSSTKSPTAAP
ncbi:MAG: LysM peptidoglycan-binding domain-containing protein, partial [Anaerolineae bacterium]